MTGIEIGALVVFGLIIVFLAVQKIIKKKEEKEVSETQKAMVDAVYKPEPKVVEVEESPQADMKEVKVEVKKTPVKKAATKKATQKKVQPKTETVEKVEKETKAKVKRAWFNNGKEQKLIPVNQETPAGFVKGKLPKGAK